MTTFYRGDVWEAEAKFTDTKTNDAVDPDVVTATVTTPEGESSGREVVRTGTGAYTCTVSLETEGQWHVVFQGTGEHAAAMPETITVQPD